MKAAMLNQPSVMALGVQDLVTTSSACLLPLGSQISLADGRKFVYGQAGGTALAKALLAMAQATDANENKETVATTGAVGAYTVGVTFGGSVTANQFAGGYIVVGSGTGLGDTYTVASHPAGTTNVTVTLNEPIRTAITAGTNTVSAIQHPCAQLVISAATAGTPVGVPLVAVTAEYYAWFQVKGPAAVLTAGTLVIGQVCNQAAGGAVAPNAGDILPACGTVLQVAANGEYSIINLAVTGF
jgi:hypothetical protein